MSSSIKARLLNHFKKNKDVLAVLQDIPDMTGDFEKIKRQISKLIKVEPPRYLTTDEIDYIVNDLPVLPCIVEKIREHNLQQVKDKIRGQLKTFKVCPKGIEKLKKDIYTQYIKSSIPAGESVGLLSAMAIGQLFTQMNLNTFHSAGSKNVSGINLIKELFNITPNKKVYSTAIHFKDKNMSYLDISNAMKHNIEEVTVNKLFKNTEIMNKVPDQDQWWYTNAIATTGLDRDAINDKPFMRIKLDYVKMLTYKVTLKDIVENLKDLNQYMVVAPLHIRIIDIYANPSSASDFKITSSKNFETVFLSGLINKCLDELVIKGISNLKDFNIESVEVLKHITSKKTGKNMFRLFIDYFSIRLEGLTQEKYMTFLSLFNLTIHGSNFKTKPYYVDVSCNPEDVTLLDESIDNYNTMRSQVSDVAKDLYNLEPVTEENLNAMHENIKAMVESQADPKKTIGSIISIHKKKVQDNIIMLNDAIKQRRPREDISQIKNKVIEATNHDVYRQSTYHYVTAYGKKILNKLIHKNEIDTNYVLPNDVNEIYEYFGIESARLFLVREYIRLINQSSYINPANIELLVDFQTSLGFLSQVTHTGVTKQQGSLLSSASFENPMSVFKQGACMGNKDDLNGISGSIMSGKKCRNGTGIVKVLFSEETKGVDLFQEHDGELAVDRYAVTEGEVRDMNYNPDLPNVANAERRAPKPPKQPMPEKKQFDIKTPVVQADIKAQLNLDDNNEDTSSIDLDSLIRVNRRDRPDPVGKIGPPYFKFLVSVNDIYSR